MGVINLRENPIAVAKDTYQRKTPSSFPTINPQKADGFVKFTEFSTIIESPAVVHHNHQWGFDIKKIMLPKIGCREYNFNLVSSMPVSCLKSFEDKKDVLIFSRITSNKICNPKKMSKLPPKTPIIMKIIGLANNDSAPTSMSKIKRNSISACPKLIKRPTNQAFCFASRDLKIVYVIKVPGDIAPPNPNKKITEKTLQNDIDLIKSQENINLWNSLKDLKY